MNISEAIKPYTLANGKDKYYFKIYTGIDPFTGKETSTTRRGISTPKLANEAYISIKSELAKGTYRKSTKLKFIDVYNQWIKAYTHTERSTLGKTLGYFKNHILPHFMNYKIEKINVHICQKFVLLLTEKLQRYKQIISYAADVMKYALMNNYISSNPFDYVKIPKERKSQKKISFYNGKELIAFLNAFSRETDLKRYMFYRLMAYSGIRKGEAVALTWGDFNFKENYVYITKAISYDEKNKKYLKSTKTFEERTICMDDETMILMKKWKVEQEKQLLNLNLKHNGEDQLVFQNIKNQHLNPTTPNKWLYKVIKHYGLKPITVYGLRHTHATLLNEAGASLAGIQQRLGHSGRGTTLKTYIHVTEKIRRETIWKLVDYLSEEIS